MGRGREDGAGKGGDPSQELEHWAGLGFRLREEGSLAACGFCLKIRLQEGSPGSEELMLSKPLWSSGQASRGAERCDGQEPPPALGGPVTVRGLHYQGCSLNI